MELVYLYMVQETVERLLGELDTDYFESITADKSTIQIERFDASFKIKIDDNTITLEERKHGQTETYSDVTVDDVTNLVYK